MINSISSAFWVIFAVALVIGIIFFVLGRKSTKKVQFVNRADIIKKKLIKVLEANKSKYMVLMQKDNVVGLTRNIALYLNNGGKIYFILYMPRFLSFVPNIFDKNILIVSEEFLDFKELPKAEKRLGKIKEKFKPRLNIELNKDFFIDEYFNIKLNYTDEKAINLLKLRILSDESETSSSVYLAQALRLSTLDLTKSFESPKIEEKVKEVEKAK